jgi:hypothetical protein
MHGTVTLSLVLAEWGLCTLSLVAQTPTANAEQQVHAVAQSQNACQPL